MATSIQVHCVENFVMSPDEELLMIDTIIILSKRRMEPIYELFSTKPVCSFDVKFVNSGVIVCADDVSVNFDIGDMSILSLEAKRIIESCLFHSIDFDRSLLSTVNRHTVDRTPIKTLCDLVKTSFNDYGEITWTSESVGSMFVNQDKHRYSALRDKIMLGSVDLDDSDFRFCLNDSLGKAITFETHTNKPQYKGFNYVGNDRYICSECKRTHSCDEVRDGCSCKDFPRYIDLRGIFVNHTTQNVDLNSENRIGKNDRVDIRCNDCGYEESIKYHHVMFYHKQSEPIKCELCNHNAIDISKIKHCLTTNQSNFSELFNKRDNKRIKSLKTILNQFAKINDRIYLNILNTADCIITKEKKKIVYKNRAIYVGIWKQNDNICFGKYGISVNPVLRFEQQKSASKNCELLTSVYFYLDDTTAKMLESRMKEIESNYVSREVFEDGYTETFDLKNETIYNVLVSHFESKKDFEKSNEIKEFYSNIKSALS